MNNCLILLTNYYPFHKGEEYLESEIEYLSRNFKKIYIISTMVSNDMKQTRVVPHNVEVLRSGIKHTNFEKCKMFLKQFKIINSSSEKKKMISEDARNNPFYLLYCYYFESRSIEIYNCIEKMLNKFNFSEYEYITLYSYWLYITARVAIEIKNYFLKEKRVLIVSRAHRYDLYEYAAPLKYLPEREFLLKSIDYIYPCSQDGVDILSRRYPNYRYKIAVRRLGTISPNVISKTINNKLHIVSCSAVRKVKRLDLLIKVLVELQNKNIPFLWTHIGDGPEFKKIKKLANKKLNINNYKFTGFINNQEVLNWYKKNISSVFINLSSSEGVPVAVMEAMSMGIPVIATDVGGTREIVESNINGYLLNKDCSVTQVIEYLIKIYKMSNEEYNKVCSNALNTWNERCNADILYSNFGFELANESKTNLILDNYK